MKRIDEILLREKHISLQDQFDRALSTYQVELRRCAHIGTQPAVPLPCCMNVQRAEAAVRAAWEKLQASPYREPAHWD